MTLPYSVIGPRPRSRTRPRRGIASLVAAWRSAPSKPGSGEEKSRYLIAALPDAALIFDRSLQISFANAAAEVLFGYGSGEMVGLRLGVLMASATRERYEEDIRAAFASWKGFEGVRGLERVARRKDGREFPVEVNANPCETAEGPTLVSIVRDISRRWAKDRALRRSRENLARAQRIAGLGNFERDLVTGEVVWSDEFLRIWGLAAEPFFGNADCLVAMVHPDDRQEFLEGRDAALRNEPVPPLDFRITRPDGEERILHREYGIIFDEKGQAVRMFGTVQDVTERKKIEIELRRSRENLARAQRIAGIGSFERDLATGRTAWSDEFYRIHGVDPGSPQANADLLRSLVHPDDAERVETFRQQAMSETPPAPIDYRIVRPDGVERILHRESHLLFDEKGRPSCVFGLMQDVTELKKAEIELRGSRENLARAHRIAALGSFERNLVTGESSWSDELRRIWGVTPDQPAGPAESLLSLVHPADRRKFIENRQAGLNRTPGPLDFRIVRPDGEERILHREYEILFDEQGNPVHTFGIIQDITERKRIENELRRSREALARAQRVAAIGSFEHDIVHDKSEWSDELYRIYGLTPVEGGPRIDLVIPLVHPEDRKKFLSIRKQVVKGIPSAAADFRLIRPDGVERILHREYDVIKDETGKPIRVYGTMQDVTEQKMAERELLRSRENMARAQRIAAMGSFERDLATNKTEWSDEMYRILGIKRGGVVPGYETLINLIHPEDRERFWVCRMEQITGRPAEPMEFRIVRPDGTERVMRRESAVVFDDNKVPVRIYGTIQDVTGRREAERELLRSRENMARAQEIASIGSFDRDLTTDDAGWSDQMFEILGIDRIDVIPGYESLIALVHPEDRAAFIAHRRTELAGAPPSPFEYRIVRPDGAERIVRRESAVVFDDERRPIRVSGTLQDITEQRLAERRERELERQLLHSQKLEALGTLAGGIAHDLNNTLVPIMALSKLMARRFEVGSLVRTNLETIFEASERARDLVKRILSFSRKDDTEKRDANLADIVDEALKLLRATVPATIQLDSQIADVPPIPADASQIHQVVTNLVSNAAQAIGGDIGTITVSLDLVPAALGGREIRLSVADTGMGMDETTQQRIFEPFFTTKDVGQGTGLGLSIVHGIIAGHGGRIGVESAPGKGTRIDIYFPVSAREASAAPAGKITSSRPAA